MKKDRTVGIISLVLGIIVCIAASRLEVPMSSAATGEPGPRVYPYLAGALLILSGIGLVLQKQKEEKKFLSKEQWVKLLILFAVIVGYAVALQFLGFVIASPIFLFIVMTMFAGEKKVSILVRIIYAVAVTAAIWLIFSKLLNSFLPTGVIFK